MPELGDAKEKRRSNQVDEQHKLDETKPPLPEGIPQKFEYDVLPARVDLGNKLAEQLRKLQWPDSGIIKLGWLGEEIQQDLPHDKEAWPKIAGLTARLMHDLQMKHSDWTYSSLTLANAKGMQGLLNRGGVGGSALWAWAKCGGVATKIGFSRKFNAGGKIVSYHSKAPAAIFPGKAETYAVLAHNLNHTAFGDDSSKEKLRRKGMMPAPMAAESDSDTTEPESENEELPPFPGLTGGLRRLTNIKNQMTQAQHKAA